MVIVTTAVYWGLNSPLRPQSDLTGPLNLPAPGRRESVYIDLPVFARTCVFSKQSLPSTLCDHHQLNTSFTSSGPPSPEVTGAFCQIPHHRSPEPRNNLYLAPWDRLANGPHRDSPGA